MSEQKKPELKPCPFVRFKHWLIKKLGGISAEEATKLVDDCQQVYLKELNIREEEIASLKLELDRQIDSRFSPLVNETIVVKTHMVEPVVLSHTYELRDFHREFDQEKVEQAVFDHLTQRIAQDIVLHKLYEMDWSDKNDPIKLARVVRIMVRVVPPIQAREEWRADNEQI